MKKKFIILNVILVLLLLGGSIAMLLPFLWMVLSSFKPAIELLKMPPVWLPEKGLWLGNYREVLRLIPFVRYMLNSLGIALINTLVGLFTCSITGYIFAKYNFRGRNVLFLAVLGSMMIPFQVIMIPMYSLMVGLKWIDSYIVLTIPYFYSIFGIFLMRQFMIKLPSDLIESAFIDGCSHFRVYLSIIIPLVRSALSALGIFLFMMSWNDYLWPLIVINSDELRTIPIGLGSFIHARGMKYDFLMASSVMAVLPIIVVFFMAQKNFIEGIALTGIKS
jgi:ABC-type glycerol-3-phosphate transport system permease component